MLGRGDPEGVQHQAQLYTQEHDPHLGDLYHTQGSGVCEEAAPVGARLVQGQGR